MNMPRWYDLVLSLTQHIGTHGLIRSYRNHCDFECKGGVGLLRGFYDPKNNRGSEGLPSSSSFITSKEINVTAVIILLLLSSH